MAIGDITFYNAFKTALKEAAVADLGSAGTTVKVALVESYTPDIDAHVFFDDVSASQVSGTGYTAGGVTLANKSVTQDNANDRAVWDADDAVWEGLDAGTPSHGILYIDTGTAGTSLLICYVELGVASNGQDYTIQWNATGISTLT